MTDIEQQAYTAVKSLNKSVNEILDIKKRLGQYAVVWKNGKVVHLFKKQNTIRLSGSEYQEKCKDKF